MLTAVTVVSARAARSGAAKRWRSVADSRCGSRCAVRCCTLRMVSSQLWRHVSTPEGARRHGDVYLERRRADGRIGDGLSNLLITLHGDERASAADMSHFEGPARRQR